MARLDDLVYSAEVMAMFVCLKVLTLADFVYLAACGACGHAGWIAMGLESTSVDRNGNLFS